MKEKVATLSGMNRNSIMLLWLAFMLGFSLVAFVLYRYAQTTRADIEQARLNLDAVYRELENAQRLSASLAQLDASTINEAIATRLEILRHLELEQNNYDVQIEARAETQVGSTILYVRHVRITTIVPYQELMAMVDKFHNNGRLVLTKISIDEAPQAEVGMVSVTIEGNLYGLEKKNDAQ